MRLLILGGTVFVGRALTDAALDAGHEVTHFRRGTTAPDPRVQTLRGDRTWDLAALASGTWDAVIDTSGYLPSIVERSARALEGRIGSYVFISTISVYAGPRYSEDAPVLPPVDEPPKSLEHYGALKAMCEARVKAVFGGGALVIRPGLIVGPHDPTDRFTYWPVRMAAGGEVLAPGRPARPVQFIDVRDLARWTVGMAVRRAAGTFNATGPASLLTMGRFLECARDTLSPTARLEWVDDAFLVEQGVKPWMEMPLWIAQGGGHEGMLETDISRALEHGLELRPVSATLRDTLAWQRTRPVAKLACGLDPAREAQLLTQWRRQRL